MLGKLLKYEFRAKRGLYVGSYIFLIIVTLLQICVLALRNEAGIDPEETLGITLRMINAATTIATWIAVMLASMAPFIIGTVRYYENLVKDEGYLMHTIPVKAWELHAAKLIVPLVWFIGACVLIALAIAPATNGVVRLSQIPELFDLDAMGAEGIFAVVLYVFIMLLSIVMSISTFYTCVNIGSLSTNNKGLMGFVAYIVIYTINQIISTIVMIVSVAIGMVCADVNTSTEGDGGIEVLIAMCVGIAIVTVISTIVFNVISVYILKKKVNLE